jgi:undecaprenyl-diphosphatase
MTKRLSEHLADLSVRAKSAEQALDSAEKEAHDVTSLGSIIVLVIITLAIVGYLFLAGKPAVAWLMLIAVFRGIAVSDLLKFAFARARPDIVAPLARVFTTSFPSGHATLSAITYLTSPIRRQCDVVR